MSKFDKMSKKQLARELDKACKFGYDCLTSKGVRKAPVARKKNEHGDLGELTKAKRDSLGATVYDLYRNCPEMVWAVNVVLDYTTAFTFQARTKDRSFNKDFEEAVWRWSLKRNCDVSGRHSLGEMMRLYGTGMLLDGDAALLKCGGYKLQGIEADRICKPTCGDIPAFVKDNCDENGFISDEQGLIQHYVICNRTSGGKEFAQLASAENVIFDGYFFRFDQPRGISPFAPSIDKFKDVAEIDLLQLIKCKEHAAFGVLLKSKGGEGGGFGERNLAGETPAEAAASGNAEVDALGKYFGNLGAGIKIEGDQGDGVDMFESRSPSPEYQAFAQNILRKALSVVGIPYSFFDGAEASFAEQKYGTSEFKNKVKQQKLARQENHYEITDWGMPGILQLSSLRPPKGLEIKYEWVERADSWLDENNEVQAMERRIAMGTSSRQLECKRRGVDWFDVADDLAAEAIEIEAKGLTVTVGQPGAGVVPSSIETDSVETDNKDTQNEQV